MEKNIIQQDLHNQLTTALRILSIEMVEEAKSGHPGMPMGFADVATILFQYLNSVIYSIMITLFPVLHCLSSYLVLNLKCSREKLFKNVLFPFKS